MQEAAISLALELSVGIRDLWFLDTWCLVTPGAGLS